MQPAQEAFASPPTLVLPHCFDAEEGTESLVMLGCRAGTQGWAQIDARTTSDGKTPVELSGGELRVKVPWPGCYCGFSSLAVEDICRVRLAVRMQPRLSPSVAVTVRVQLCPDLPDQLAVEQLEQASLWGLAADVAEHRLSLYQGTTIEFKLGDITEKVTWYGSVARPEPAAPSLPAASPW